MQEPPLDPDVADMAPSAPALTGYDQEHLVTYLRLLDADSDSADWREVARIVLHIDPERVHVTPDCGFSQTARHVAVRKLTNMAEGVRIVRRELTA